MSSDSCGKASGNRHVAINGAEGCVCSSTGDLSRQLSQEHDIGGKGAYEHHVELFAALAASIAGPRMVWIVFRQEGAWLRRSCRCDMPASYPTPT